MGGLLLSAWGTIHSQMGNGSLSSMKRACRQPHLIIYSGDNVPEWRRKASSRPASRKGNSYERVWSVMRCLVCVGCCTGFCAMISQANRRKGRPAWTRNPDDTPLRDGNRDRLIGLLTERYMVLWVDGVSVVYGDCGGCTRRCYPCCYCLSDYMLLLSVTILYVCDYVNPPHTHKHTYTHTNKHTRAAKTLLYYLSETNLHVFHWFQAFIKAHPIPRNGDWDDVSGETFLRTLLAMSPDQAKFDMV